MRPNLKLAAAVLTMAMLAGTNATVATAGDTFSFPSASGAMIATSAPTSVPPAQAHFDAGAKGLSLGGGVSITGASKTGNYIPLPGGSSYKDFNERVSGDPYSYRFLTHALASQSFANYAADYYRIFAPAYAVTAWTERVSGIIDVGYGGAVDNWTSGAYYLGRVRGPRTRRDSPPDLSTMPNFHPHPELENPPTFKND